MARQKTDSTVLTVRVSSALDRRLAREARRRGQTRSEVVRSLLENGLGSSEPDLDSEARRQSLLVSRRRSEKDALRFITHAADTTTGR